MSENRILSLFREVYEWRGTIPQTREVAIDRDSIEYAREIFTTYGYVTEIGLKSGEKITVEGHLRKVLYGSGEAKEAE